MGFYFATGKRQQARFALMGTAGMWIPPGSLKVLRKLPEGKAAYVDLGEWGADFGIAPAGEPVRVIHERGMRL